MGVIAWALAVQSGTSSGSLQVPEWVIVSCAAAIALGLSTGGWHWLLYREIYRHFNRSANRVDEAANMTTGIIVETI